MDDDRSVVVNQHPDLDQVGCPVGAEEQDDVVVVGVICRRDDVSKGVAYVVVGNAMIPGTSDYRCMPQRHDVSIP